MKPLLTRAIQVIVVATVLSAVSLKFLPLPFAWIGLWWAVALLLVAVKASSRTQVPILICSSLAMAVAAVELVLFAITPAPVDVVVTPLVADPDSLLGWRPKPLRVSHARASTKADLVYDVHYSIDSAGHRVSMEHPSAGRGREACAFFFIDSFTFGQGVDDYKDFASVVASKMGGRVYVVNFAAQAYGAEHMLAMLERGELAQHAPCEPTHLIYAALPHHVLRAAGKTDYSMYGPRYALGPNGVPYYVKTPMRPSQDSSQRETWSQRLNEQLHKSSIYRTWSSRSTRTPGTEADVQLYFAIVRRAFRIMEDRWPAAERHIISWDIHDFYSNGAERFHTGLATVNAKVHFIDDILPGYTKAPSEYGLSPGDLHPSPKAHAMVASYLADRVFPRSLPKGAPW